MTALPLRAVLDTSAVVAYAHGSIDVGETLGEICDENAGFVVPIVCLLAAADQLPDDRQPMLDVLAKHQNGVVLHWNRWAGAVRPPPRDYWAVWTGRAPHSQWCSARRATF